MGENYSELEVALEVLATACKAGVITFTLGIASPFRRRFPLLKTRGDFCNWVRWYKGAECKYSGPIATCKGTLADCRAHGNSVNFGGQPGLGKGGMKIA
jgi:phage-related protein